MTIEGDFYIKYNSETCSQAYYDINLDLCTSGLLQNQSIDLLSTHTSNLSQFHLVNIVRL